MSRISVCIPVYNGVNHLPETLESIRRQRLSDIKILLSVDRSDDESLDLCKDEQIRDNRITVHAHRQRLGFVQNVHFLMKQADTEFLCVTPQDDWIDPDYLSALLAVMERNPQAALAYSDMKLAGNSMVESQASLQGDQFTRLASYLARQVNHIEWRGLIRKSCVDVGYDFNVHQPVDHSLPLNLAHAGELIRVPRVLYIKQPHPGSATASQRNSELGRFTRIRDSLESCLTCYMFVSSRCRNEIERQIAGAAFILRLLTVIEINWPLEQMDAIRQSELRCFGEFIDTRLDDVFMLYDLFTNRTNEYSQYQQMHSILAAEIYFHLAVIARHYAHSSYPELLEYALQLEPCLAELNEFHQCHYRNF